MKKNRLGTSELMVSEIGLGCMSLGTDMEPAIDLIHEALDHGVNLLDTADLYDEGRNEEIVGQAIKGRRDQVVVATKVGNRRIAGKEGWSWDPSKAYIKQAVHESLKRLQTDYIDLYQLHGGTLDDPIEETIEAFEELKKEGLIRYYGISSIRPNVIREYVKRASIVSVMNQYSVADRRAEEEVLPLLEQKGISVIARGPVASGVLAESRICQGRQRLSGLYARATIYHSARTKSSGHGSTQHGSDGYSLRIIPSCRSSSCPGCQFKRPVAAQYCRFEFTRAHSCGNSGNTGA